jgi:uncharacterized oligopeptide transporter (OPT) family protein
VAERRVSKLWFLLLKDVNLDGANLPWPQGIAAARSIHASAQRFQ